MQLTQQQLTANNFNLRAKRIRLELLDFSMKTIDTIEGDCIGGSITYNANDDIRRSGNIDVAIPINKSATNFLDTLDGYSIELGGKIWLDKYIKVFIGIDDTSKTPTQTVWYNKGVYLIDQPVRSFNATQFTISFNIIDLMAKLTGLRQGQLTGQGITYEAFQTDNSKIPPTTVRTKMADILISTIEDLSGFEKYSIYPIPSKYEYLPYDISIGVGSSVYDILKQFMDILSNWQMYFDNDGILIIEPIPNGENDSVIPIEYEQLITNELSIDFQNVKNQIVLYGKLNDATYYTENTDTLPTNVQYSGNTLILTYTALTTDNFSVLGTTFGFRSLTQYNSVPLTNVKIYNGTTLIINSPLVDFEGYDPTTQTKTYMTANAVLPNTIYLLRIFNATLITSGTIDFAQPIIMEFYSKQQVSWCLVNDNKESPFYINANLNSENYYCGTATTESTFNVGENYTLTLNDEGNVVTSLNNGTILTFMANYPNLYANGFDFTSITVKNSNGTILAQDIPLVSKKWTLNTTTQKYERLPIAVGKVYADYTIWELQFDISDPQNVQFIFVGRFNGAITKVLSGGEYDVIFADRLAYERCIWELYLASSLNNNIKLGIIPNYALDVNMKIPYNESWAMPIDVNAYSQYVVNAQTVGDTQNYNVSTTNGNHLAYLVKDMPDNIYFMIKSVTFPLGMDNSTQNIEAIQIYRDKNLVGSDYTN